MSPHPMRMAVETKGPIEGSTAENSRVWLRA